MAKGSEIAALKAAFPKTIPILAGFLFLGMTYGIYARVSGLPLWFPILMSVTVFAGSMEFVAVGLLLGGFHPLLALGMTLMINARHLFYGLSMLDKYRGMGWKQFYLIFGMCDESFSVNCSAEAPDGIDRSWFMFFVTLLNQSYWITGATLGSLLGSLVSFSTEGIDFVMTAMFVVIFLEGWLKETSHVSSLLGLGVTLLCRVLFGVDLFLLIAMPVILAVLFLQGYRNDWKEGTLS
ncbi:MAG: AzlC family ABC transporter permease [Clostridia bacterium]|nr:AzlC family ABC transporter permease [Clostridia bacterium]